MRNIITIEVTKQYKNSGKDRHHRRTTKRYWKHHFFDLDIDRYCTEWVSSLKAIYLKTQIHHELTFVCLECENKFVDYIKNKKDMIDCPDCGGNSMSQFTTINNLDEEHQERIIDEIKNLQVKIDDEDEDQEQEESRPVNTNSILFDIIKAAAPIITKKIKKNIEKTE